MPQSAHSKSTPMKSTHLLFLPGSAREGSFNKRLARLGVDIAHANGIAATFADLGDYPMPIYDGDLETASGAPANAVKLKALMAVHSGILIVAPEYNAGVTPLLKNALDWVSRVRTDGEEPLAVFKTRVFALASASPGRLGGLRGLTAVRQTLELGVGALVLPDQLAVSGAGDAFDERGHLKDGNQHSAYKSLIEKLARASRVLHGT